MVPPKCCWKNSLALLGHFEVKSTEGDTEDSSVFSLVDGFGVSVALEGLELVGFSEAYGASLGLETTEFFPLCP